MRLFPLEVWKLYHEFWILTTNDATNSGVVFVFCVLLLFEFDCIEANNFVLITNRGTEFADPDGLEGTESTVDIDLDGFEGGVP